MSPRGSYQYEKRISLHAYIGRGLRRGKLIAFSFMTKSFLATVLLAMAGLAGEPLTFCRFFDKFLILGRIEGADQFDQLGEVLLLLIADMAQ